MRLFSVEPCASAADYGHRAHICRPGRARMGVNGPRVVPPEVGSKKERERDRIPSRLLKKGRLPLTLNCESDSYANKGMAGGIDARFGCADG
jgi:hypothetical protein